MIRLFRHDGVEIMLNIDMIQEIRSGPKTVLVLVNGETLQVKNTQTDVLTKMRACCKGKEDEERELNPLVRRSARAADEPPHQEPDARPS